MKGIFMHKQRGRVFAAVLGAAIMLTSCGGGNANTEQATSKQSSSAGSATTSGENMETLNFEGVLLNGTSILITNSSESSLAKGELVSVTMPQGAPAPPVGSLFRYEIMDAIRESWPPQASAVKIDEIKSAAGPLIISFDTAEDILMHLGENTHFIDVRTAEEYISGHVSGAKNIDVAVIRSEIATAVPEKSDVVILYCRSGNRSNQAARMLQDMGYSVLMDAGGIISFKGDVVQGQDPGPLPGQP